MAALAADKCGNCGQYNCDCERDHAELVGFARRALGSVGNDPRVTPLRRKKSLATLAVIVSSLLEQLETNDGA